MYFFGQRNLKIDIQHCFLQVYNDNIRKYTHNIKKFFTINFVEIPTKKKKKEKKFFKKNWWNLVNKKIKKILLQTRNHRQQLILNCSDSILHVCLT